MRSSSLVPLVLTAVIAGGVGYFAATRIQSGTTAATASAGGERKIKFYQSPMHPWITSDRPGKCTICGMDLVPVYEGEAGFSTDGSVVALTPASASVIGVQTAEVRSAQLGRTLRVTGVLDDDETKHRVIVARAPGRIEQLHVNQVGAEVAAGEPLATIYSPEVLSAQRTYIERIKAGPSGFSASEQATARERLLILGLTEDVVKRIESTLKPENSVTLYAPFAGTIVERKAYPGQYVETDSPLFEMGDLSTLWFIFDAYEADLAWLRVGQTVEVSTPSRPGETFTAPIAFIDPNLNETTRTARVRVVLDNADRKLLHRQTATGRVQIASDETLVVPRSAVLHTRAQPVVYVDKGGGAYEPRTVKAGRAGDGDIEIIDGLRAGEKVVTQGALLLDGQAQLAHAAGPATDAAGGQMSEVRGQTSVSGTATPVDAKALTPLAIALAEASAALAADDLAGYQKALPAMSAAVHQTGAIHATLMPLAEKLVAGPDIKTARRAFEPFATAVADAAKAAGLHTSGVVRIFQCPMTPVLGTGRWLQTTADLRNPFFGAAMLTCGEEIR
ncbi:MAG TPA: efflux RND transporter periplasmic adaptor subunit [Opitutaceae bacterium]